MLNEQSKNVRRLTLVDIDNLVVAPPFMTQNTINLLFISPKSFISLNDGFPIQQSLQQDILYTKLGNSFSAQSTINFISKTHSPLRIQKNGFLRRQPVSSSRLFHPHPHPPQIYELYLFCESLMAAWRFGGALSEITRRNPIRELLRCRIPVQGSMLRIRLLCLATESCGFRFFMLLFRFSCFESDQLLDNCPIMLRY
ncbi:hypothetical protein CDAR_209231 [Caerostris darwini]|uniref:Uncharacterized protein n=1 Tax=Caerostris darwini TaxID=1538125 RepID=A0AAV4VHH0_9ARAC|nr:hypothetical protein CDAR_209231 [Caerostris darwini]